MKSNIFRLTYSRDENVKFVSHLDIVHVFERAIRRADIQIAYSNGFNPRMLLVFGNPLPVGLTSSCEMVDIELLCEMEDFELLDLLSKNLPKPFKIISVLPLKKPFDNIVKLYTEATYLISIETPDYDFTVQKILSYYSTGLSIPAVKKSKSGDKEIDIRPMIYNISDESGNILLSVSHTPEASVKAELCINALANRLSLDIKINSIHKISVS